MQRLDLDQKEISSRVESKAYLQLVKKSMLSIRQQQQEDKRKMIQELLFTAATQSFCSDELVSIFIDWISKYSLGHFSVIFEIHDHGAITRKKIWNNMNGQQVKENSHEADLFKLVLHELSVSQLIRQQRSTDEEGNFLARSKKNTKTKKNAAPKVLKSVFDDEKPYELTALGEKLVAYIHSNPKSSNKST